MSLIQVCSVCGYSISFLDTSTGKRELCKGCTKCDKFKASKIVLGTHKECYKPKYRVIER